MQVESGECVLCGATITRDSLVNQVLTLDGNHYTNRLKIKHTMLNWCTYGKWI